MTTKTKKGSAKRPPQADQKRKFPVLWVVFGAIAALLVAAIVFSGEESIGSGGEYGDVTVSGESLPQMSGDVAFDPHLALDEGLQRGEHREPHAATPAAGAPEAPVRSRASTSSTSPTM